MGEITSSDMKGRGLRAVSPPPRRRKNSTVEVRNETITSVASEPMAVHRIRATELEAAPQRVAEAPALDHRRRNREPDEPQPHDRRERRRG